MTEELKKWIGDFTTDIYERTVRDNEEDVKMLMCVITKLAAYLIAKGVLTSEELKDIVNLQAAIDISKEIGVPENVMKKDN